MKRHPLTFAIAAALEPLPAPAQKEQPRYAFLEEAAAFVERWNLKPYRVGVDYARGPDYGVTVIGKLLPDGTLQVLAEYERRWCDQPLLLLAR